MSAMKMKYVIWSAAAPDGVKTGARYGWPAIGERCSEVLQSVAEKKSSTVHAIAARLTENAAQKN